MTIDEYLTFAHELADAAGAVLRARFRQPLTTERKSDHSPVTDADREVEAAMRALIHVRYPTHGIFGEEDERVNPEASLQWVLDPIDGTRAFVAGYPLFTTLIALTQNNVPVLGIIDQPVLRERWSGAKDKPTLFNGKPITLSGNKTQLAQATVATTSAPYFTPPQGASFARLSRVCATTILGGDAYAYGMLASGQLGAVVDAAMKPYDFCALCPVIQGAGGTITDWSGAPVSLESGGDVVASANAMLHEEILSHLKQ